jgi:CrcB protein
MNPSALLVVFVGGVLGGLARYGLTELWPAPDDHFPTVTLLINTTGAFALAALLAALAARWPGATRPRLLLGTGFLGAYTTFSSVMTVVARQWAHGHAALAGTYLVASLVLAVPAVLLGMAAGRLAAA